MFDHRVLTHTLVPLAARRAARHRPGTGFSTGAHCRVRRWPAHIRRARPLAVGPAAGIRYGR
jgi:hypothetical protein